MSDQKGENINGPPNYPGPPQPQAAYMMNNMPQPQSTGQQPQPGVQTQWEQTTTRTAMGGHPQMIPMQQQTMGQPQMMGMNTQMNMGTPQQPNSTGVMMNVIMPGGAGTNNLCQQGMHLRTKRQGTCGIITAIICFPIGLIALFIDVEEYCTRCGARF